MSVESICKDLKKRNISLLDVLRKDLNPKISLLRDLTEQQKLNTKNLPNKILKIIVEWVRFLPGLKFSTYEDLKEKNISVLDILRKYRTEHQNISNIDRIKKNSKIVFEWMQFLLLKFSTYEDLKENNITLLDILMKDLKLTAENLHTNISLFDILKLTAIDHTIFQKKISRIIKEWLKFLPGLKFSVCEDLEKKDISILDVLRKDLELTAVDCDAILKEIFDKNLIEKASDIFGKLKQLQRKCNNPEMGFLVNPTLLLDDQIILYKDPNHPGVVYCFEKQAIGGIIAYGKNPYVPDERLSEEFLREIRNIQDRPDATVFGDMINEIFGDKKVIEMSDLERKRQAINAILDKIDKTIDLDRFLASENKKLPRGVGNNEKSIIEYLYNNKDRDLLGLPLIYVIVKYDDNLNVIKSEEQRLRDLPREREIELERIRAEGREETDEEKRLAEARAEESDESDLAKDANAKFLPALNRAFGEVESTTMNIASRNGRTDILEALQNSGQIDYTDDAMDMASANGHLNVLQWWKYSGLPLRYTENAIGLASQGGHVNVLQWWKDTGLHRLYTEYAIDFASADGRVNVLQWWKNSGLELKYTDRAIDLASADGHVNVLQWWKNSGLELKYTVAAINLASMDGHVNVLQWWKNSGLQMRYTENAIDNSSQKGQVNVLEWWKNSGLPLKYTTLAINLASTNRHVDVLEWWKNSGSPLKYTSDAINLASVIGLIDVLEWWKNSGLRLKYTSTAIDDTSSQEGNINVLQWWKNSGLKLKYTDDAMDLASANGKIDVLQWWKDSGLELKYSWDAMDDASKDREIDVLQWWKDSGLKLLYNDPFDEYDELWPDVRQWWRNSGLPL